MRPLDCSRRWARIALALAFVAIGCGRSILSPEAPIDDDADGGASAPGQPATLRGCGWLMAETACGKASCIDHTVVWEGEGFTAYEVAVAPDGTVLLASGNILAVDNEGNNREVAAPKGTFQLGANGTAFATWDDDGSRWRVFNAAGDPQGSMTPPCEDPFSSLDFVMFPGGRQGAFECGVPPDRDGVSGFTVGYELVSVDDRSLGAIATEDPRDAVATIAGLYFLQSDGVYKHAIDGGRDWVVAGDFERLAVALGRDRVMAVARDDERISFLVDGALIATHEPIEALDAMSLSRDGGHALMLTEGTLGHVAHLFRDGDLLTRTALPSAVSRVSSIDVSDRGDMLFGVHSRYDEGCVLLMNDEGKAVWAREAGSAPLSRRWPLAQFYPNGERLLLREPGLTSSVIIGPAND